MLLDEEEELLEECDDDRLLDDTDDRLDTDEDELPDDRDDIGGIGLVDDEDVLEDDEEAIACWGCVNLRFSRTNALPLEKPRQRPSAHKPLLVLPYAS